MKARRGFTLIELLVVISIISLLSSVVLASVSGAKTKTNIAVRKENLRSLVTALELYRADFGSYPSSSGCTGNWCGEASYFGSKGYSGSTGYIPNLAPTYIPTLPKDPKVNDPNCNNAGPSGYAYRSNGTDYKIADFCLDGVPSSDSFYDPSMPGFDLYLSTPGGAAFIVTFFF